MSDEGCLDDFQHEWHEFLEKLHANNENTKQKIQKVDIFPQTNLVCFILYDVFSSDECEFIINSMEHVGFNKLLYGDRYRTNTRTQITQRALADEFFRRVEDYLPKKWPGEGNTSHWELKNLNERLRLCRYEAGQYFSPHFDGVYKRSFMEQSQMTIMAYLNDSFTDGNTNFLDPSSKPHPITYALKPKAGMVLIFQHDIFHEGEAVTSGKKYIMRSDVMYDRFLIEPISTTEHTAREMLAEAERLEDQSQFDEAAKCYRKAYKLWPPLENEFTK